MKSQIKMPKALKNQSTDIDATCAKQMAIGLRLLNEFNLTDATACIGEISDYEARRKSLSILLTLERDGLIIRVKDFDDKHAPLRGGAAWVKRFPLCVEGLQ